MYETLEFLCPECEGRQFGPTPGGFGRCRSCGHQWDRKQDYVYFVVVQRFTKPAEYQRRFRRQEMSGAIRRIQIATVLLLVLALLAGAYILWGS